MNLLARGTVPENYFDLKKGSFGDINDFYLCLKQARFFRGVCVKIEKLAESVSNLQ